MIDGEKMASRGPGTLRQSVLKRIRNVFVRAYVCLDFVLVLRMDGCNHNGYDHTPTATTPPHTWDTCTHVAQPIVYNRET